MTKLSIFILVIENGIAKSDINKNESFIRNEQEFQQNPAPVENGASMYTKSLISIQFHIPSLFQIIIMKIINSHESSKYAIISIIYFNNFLN